LRRDELRRAHAGYDNLTATGRYRIAEMVKPRKVEEEWPRVVRS